MDSWFSDATRTLYHGDSLAVLQSMPSCSVQCVVTSPPYWALRDYGVAGQLGLEATPQEYVANMVAVFREVRRVLRDDGSLWLNIGDSFSAGGKLGGRAGSHSTLGGSRDYQDAGRGSNLPAGLHAGVQSAGAIGRAWQGPPKGLKHKDLVGIPWMLAFALREDGWYLRSEVIWQKRCLSGGVWLYARTTKGDAPAMLKDLVRLDPATVQLWDGSKWVNVLGWGKTPKQDARNYLEIEFRNGERIGCTRDHRWPTSRGVLFAGQLQPGDVVDTCDLPEPPEKPDLCFDDNELGWLCGFYLAEGCKTPKGACFSVHSDERAEFLRIQKAAELLGGTASMRKLKGKAAVITAYCTALRELLASFIVGNSCLNKRLSRKAWGRSNVFLAGLLQGYLDGDGHKTGNRWRIGFGNNDGLAVDLRCLCARLGRKCRIKRAFYASKGKKHPGWRGSIPNASQHHNSKMEGEIVAIRASRAREFYDVSVDQEPNLFALASGILTHNSPMPESVRDRPTKAHEQIFLLTKQRRYFYDLVGSQEDCAAGNPRGSRFDLGKTAGHQRRVGSRPREDFTKRNMRSVWSLSSYPLKAAHFAAFPPELVRRCLSAGVSERGCCSNCGTPWVRETTRNRVPTRHGRNSKVTRASQHIDSPYESHSGMVVGNRDAQRHVTVVETVGWKANCLCKDASIVPCVVLDVFHGAGTVMKVCERLGLNYVGIELNEEYLRLSMERPAVKFPDERSSPKRKGKKSKQMELFPQ